LVERATDGPVTATVRVERGAAVIPETLTVTLEVESERGVEIAEPSFGESLGDFGVKSVAASEATEDDMTRRQQWVVTLEPFVAGQSEVPPLTVAYLDRRERADGSAGDHSGEVRTPAIPVKVEERLADVKGPATIDVPTNLRLLLYVLLVVGALLLVALAARWMRRRFGAARPVKAEPAPLPHLWALAELDRLAAEELVGRGLVQEFYYRINYLLRRYIELRFGLMAGEQTSEEFVRELHRDFVLAPPHKEVLRRFVEACDPVKYALHRPGSDEIAWVQKTAREFIVETAARPEEMEAGADGRAALSGAAA